MSRQFFDNFKNPPAGYGIVPFYWWVGDPVTKERIAWQLGKLANHHIAGLQINYAHQTEGGLSYGLSMPGDPPVFSEEWWDLLGWLMGQGKKYGFSVSLSDYTLSGVGQGYYTDTILALHPELRGYTIQKKDGVYKPVLVYNSYNPLHPLSGQMVVEHFFGAFEKRFPDELGKGINFFFSDELDFSLRGNLWGENLPEEFIRIKGYDVMPHLATLFEEPSGDATKIRLDYADVVSFLQEKNYFKPIYDWHEKHGMTYGCDHGGRGLHVTEFGDYFRAVKYNQGPGCDQPRLQSNIIKNKVASSIAHLYGRKRVWLEGFHSSGWGTSSEDLTDAIARNYVMGQNLLSLHGLYYTTHGGFWEWAPPCNCFRMPYWGDMTELSAAVERLSFAMSQGVHVCDVAIVYPVAAVEGGVSGDISVKAAFAAAETLYSSGIDLDFIDFESVVDAEITEGSLRVAGESYRIVIVPAMKTVRFSMMEKLSAFKKAGGILIALDCLPLYSDRAGGGDPVLNDAVSVSFPQGPCQSSHLLESIHSLIPVPDFAVSSVPQQTSGEKKGLPVYVNHRRLNEDADLYMLYGIAAGTKCFFRVPGKKRAILLDPYSGEGQELSRLEETAAGLVLEIPRADALCLICFEGGKADHKPLSLFYYHDVVRAEYPLPDEWDFELRPTLDNRYGDFRLPASDDSIGPELRVCRYAENSSGELPADSEYIRTVRLGYGPHLLAAGPFVSRVEFNAAVYQAAKGDFSAYSPYEFSWRYGVWDDPGKEGVHGLKGKISNDFLTIGEKHETDFDTEYRPFPDGKDGRAFAAKITSKKDSMVDIIAGGKKPDVLYIDGVFHAPDQTRLPLKTGAHTLVAGYHGFGRTHLVLAESAVDGGEKPEPFPLSMSWLTLPFLLPFDHSPLPAYCFYRFASPPGLETIELVSADRPEVWDGNSWTSFTSGKENPLQAVPIWNNNPMISAHFWRAVFKSPLAESRDMVIRLKPSSPLSGGAALGEYIRFSCKTGRIKAGDWSKVEGLSSYSGGAEYRTVLILPRELPPGRPVLELEKVIASASVSVNGQSAGLRLAPPWCFFLDGLLRPGKNDIAVTVHNTLSNHYQSIPTRYRGENASGILGRAFIRFYTEEK